MKFTGVLSALLATVATVSAAAEIVEDSTPQYLDFKVDYHITEFPDVTQTDVANFVNGDEVTISYLATNNEKTDVTVVGIGGAFRDPATNEIRSNLTSGSIGPIVLAPGQSEVFNQNIPLNLIPDNYLFTPQLFIAINDQLRLLPLRGQLAVVIDKPLSVFNPQLLFLELLLLATFGGLAYFVYDTWGKQYIQGTAPVTAVKVKRAASPSAPAAASGQSYDASWIPEAHLKQKKSSKKAN